LGTRLLGRWLDVAAERGRKATHVAVNSANAGAIQFWSKMGFAALDIEDVPRGRTVWMGRD